MFSQTRTSPLRAVLFVGRASITDFASPLVPLEMEDQVLMQCKGGVRGLRKALCFV